MAHYLYKKTPYAHQELAFNRFYGKSGALLAEMGTGKSKAILDILSNMYVEKLIEAVIIIAPNGVQRQWASEQLPEHCPVNYCCVVYENKGTVKYKRDIDNLCLNQKDIGLRVICVNIDTFSHKSKLSFFIYFLKTFKTAIVLDESTTIKNPDSLRTGHILNHLGEKQKINGKIVYKPYSLYRYVLTGTMVTNSPFDLWSMLEFVQPGYWNEAYSSFKCRYGLLTRDSNPVTGRIFKRLLTQKEIHLVNSAKEKGLTADEIKDKYPDISLQDILYMMNCQVTKPYKGLSLLRDKIQDISLVIKKSDCLDLPDKIYTKIECKMTDEQKSIYQSMKKNFLSELEDKEMTANNALSAAIRLQQIAGGHFHTTEKEVKAIRPNPKLAALMQELNEADGVCIVWAVFVAEIETILKEIVKNLPEKSVSCYYGGIPQKQREEIIKDFKNNEIDILIANPTVAGVGFNFQNCSLNFIYSNNYSFATREQMEARTHRPGQVNHVVYKDFVLKDTVDEKILFALKEHKDLLDFFRERQDFINFLN